MTASYLSYVGQNVATSARMVGLTRLAGLSRVLGRAAGAAGIAYALYEAGTFALAKSPGNPALNKLALYRAEREKWQAMVSCLGREPFAAGKSGSIAEGGAINALYPKVNYGGQAIPPNEAEAQALIERFAAHLETTVNLTGMNEFDAAKQELKLKVEDLKNSLSCEDIALADVQRKMSVIVTLIKPFEAFYVAKANEVSRNAGSI